MFEAIRIDRTGHDPERGRDSADHAGTSETRITDKRRLTGWLFATGVAAFLTLLLPLQHFLAIHAARRFLSATPERVPPPPDWLQLFIAEIPVWFGWLLMLPFILEISRRFPLTGPSRVRSLLAHVPAALGTTLAVVVITTAFRFVVFREQHHLGYWENVAFGFLRYFAYFLTVYAGIVAAHHAVMYYAALQQRALKTSQLETQLAHAQLDALKMQIHPHFLFNTLNTIASLMFKDVYAAQTVIARLSELLRRSLENAAVHEVPLKDELSFLEQYVEIQKIRFQDRLQVDYDIDPDSHGVLVPRLLLQPILENSIRHGIEKRAIKGHIRVITDLSGGHLRIEIRDNGPGLSNGRPAERKGGVGLRNARARLQQLYGDDHSIEIRNVEPHGLSVSIEIPARPLAGTVLEEV